MRLSASRFLRGDVQVIVFIFGHLSQVHDALYMLELGNDSLVWRSEVDILVEDP
jgi:hypothetical protein